ncbi:Uncharacterized protein PHSC3_001041 [Chlamydiales bacterium STE3]|nr:Uncharacterized protein PHSC3_001041 [Chlamydiales bacterium STE3]
MLPKKNSQPSLLSLQKIWNQPSHNALTDLIFFKDRWFVIFRESDAHVFGKNGVIRILASKNGQVWSPTCTLEEEGYDLRDPKLSVTPDGALMLLVGASRFNRSKKRIAHQSMICFSRDGIYWGNFYPILSLHDWLWRITWYQGIAYGISYRFTDPSNPKKEWVTTLWRSQDAVNYQAITEFVIPGKPNEATIRFFPTGQMVALLRREAEHDNKAWIGTSFPPYEDWIWSESNHFFGGPNFVITDKEVMWASGRVVYQTPYGEFPRTVLAQMTLRNLSPSLILQSGGDCSYPGMVCQDHILWLSYYSSHEGIAAIYLAKIDLG